ncbi:MAG: hypothetical protein IJ555_11980 [Ruminococcus sp.]|nr:hypothetical protein [Ruminococcus sp.]
MKEHPFRFLLLCILIGALVGSLIGAAGLMGLVPKDIFLSVSGAVIKICFGLIVLMVDVLCAFGLLRPLVSQRIDREGKRTAGIINDVTINTLPSELGEDEWTQKARFSFTVHYKAGERDIEKKFPPTCLTSRRELYPQNIEQGSEIPVKYLEITPRSSIIDIEYLKAGALWEQKNARVHFIMIPLIITAAYIIVLILA